MAKKDRNWTIWFILIFILAIIGFIALAFGLATGVIYSNIAQDPDFLCKEMGWTFGESVKGEIYCHRTVWGTEYTQNYRVLRHCDRSDWQCQTEVYLEAR